MMLVSTINVFYIKLIISLKLVHVLWFFQG
jgi:hypothetical protein